MSGPLGRKELWYIEGGRERTCIFPMASERMRLELVVPERLSISTLLGEEP